MPDQLCPRCQAPLVVKRIADHLSVCNTCGEPLRDAAPAAVISAKAQVSLMLGVLSFVFSVFTALPAVLLGWLALSDIRLKPDRFQGKGIALSGIGLGLFVTAMNGGCLAWVMRDRVVTHLVARGTETIVPAESEWKWLHPIDGVDPATDDEDFYSTFNRLEFDDSEWMTDYDSAGPDGGFGYGDVVAVDIGRPPDNERRAAYFRHRFSTAEDYTDLSLQLRRDDGVVVYLNGTEVARDNVQDGPVGFELLAQETISGDAESMLRRIHLAADLAAGSHVLVISLHNRGLTSSDLRLGEISLHGRPVGE